MRYSHLLAFGFALSVCALPVAVSAQALPAELYEAQAPVADEGEAARDAALPGLLAQVLVKLTGDRGVPARPEVNAALGEAGSLLRQFRYRQQLDTVEGVAEYRTYLVAGFDPAAVEAFMQRLGLALWPWPRPAPVLWLAIDDGRGPRLVTAPQGAAVQPLRASLGERGLSLTVPIGSAEEAEFGLQAAWREDLEAAAAVAGRYEGPVQLLGRLFRAGDGWRAQWRLLEQGGEIDRWTEAGDDARLLLAQAGERSADVLAVRFAELAASGPPGRYRIRVVGLASAEDYVRVLGYLRGLSLVRGVAPVAASDEGLLLDLDLAAGLEGFTRLAAAGPLLQPQPGGPPPEFRLRP